MKKHIAQKLKHSNMFALKWSVVLKTFGQGMCGVFEPILFYKMFGDSFSLTLMFYSIQSLLFALTVHYGARLMSRFGIKVNLIIGTLFLVLTSVVTYFMFGGELVLAVDTGRVVGYLSLLMVLTVLYQIFYWPAFHTDLSLFMESKNSGKELGLFFLIGKATAVAGPVIGAWFLVSLSVKALMLWKLIFVLLSVIPLLWVLNEKPKFTMSFKSLMRELMNKKNLLFYLPFHAEGVNGYINWVVWGLFLYFTLNSFTSVGWITAIVSLCTGVFVFLLGVLTDKRKLVGKKLFTGGVLISSVGWLVKGLSGTGLFYMVADNIQKFGDSVLNVPFAKLRYDRFRNTKSLADEYVVIRGMAYHFSGAAIMFLLALFVAFFDITYIAFVIASITSLMYLLMDQSRLK